MGALAVVERAENDHGIPVVKTIPKMRQILTALANGSTMKEACRGTGCSPWKFWYHRQHNPDVASAYEAAVTMGREAIAEQCLEIARRTTYEDVAVNRLLIDVMRWKAAKVLGGRIGTPGGGATINIDQRTVTVGEAISQVQERRRDLLKAALEGEATESSEE